VLNEHGGRPLPEWGRTVLPRGLFLPLLPQYSLDTLTMCKILNARALCYETLPQRRAHAQRGRLTAAHVLAEFVEERQSCASLAVSSSLVRWTTPRRHYSMLAHSLRSPGCRKTLSIVNVENALCLLHAPAFCWTFYLVRDDCGWSADPVLR